MKKATISITFDEEKLSAIKIYMAKKDADLDTELLSQLEKLYKKFVPLGIREFISERYSEEEIAPLKRSSKQSGDEK